MMLAATVIIGIDMLLFYRWLLKQVSNLTILHKKTYTINFYI